MITDRDKVIQANKVGVHRDICENLTCMFAQKNMDYGDSFSNSLKEYGMVAPCIRIEEKLDRLKSLTLNDKEQEVIDEPITDTLMDLANYAIMTIMERMLMEDDEPTISAANLTDCAEK